MKLLTINQASEKLNLSTRSLYRMVSERQIPHCHVGTALRFPEEELDDFLEKKMVRPAEGRVLSWRSA